MSSTASERSAVRGAPERELFGDRLARMVASRRSQLVLGLDPDPARLWPAAHEGVVGDAAPDSAQVAAALAAQAVQAHCALVIDAVAAQCVAVKLQIACFERLGVSGWRALTAVIAHARRTGLLVIADAKRGDIDVSAAAYGQAYFGHTSTPYGEVPGLGVDALTVNPLLGADSLGPLVDDARGAGAGLFVLVRTSNPGASDVQDQPLREGGTVSEHLARLVARLGAGEGGLSDVGAVVGATAAGHLAALRELMPRAVFLLPGVGAPGGRVEDLAPAFEPGPAGGLVAVSRGLVYAYEREGGDPALAAAKEAERLRELAWRLAG
jgi:orotidine-5'-phosphate decarboxylase